MTPRALVYLPHEGCAEMAAFLNIDDDCDGDGPSDAEQSFTLRSGQAFDASIGDVIVIDPTMTIVQDGARTLIVIDAATAAAIRGAT